MADLTTLQTRLTEAEAALHDLLTGRREVSVSWASGQQVSYSKSDLPELRRYIQQLKAEIAELTGANRRAPISLWPA
jgi:hypothetical protein